MADSISPHYRDEAVAFDDLLVERWHRAPCVLCQHAAPGYYVLWREHATGFVAMFPLCQPCQRRPNARAELASAVQYRLHPEEAATAATWTAGDETARQG